MKKQYHFAKLKKKTLLLFGKEGFFYFPGSGKVGFPLLDLLVFYYEQGNAKKEKHTIIMRTVDPACGAEAVAFPRFKDYFCHRSNAFRGDRKIFAGVEINNG